MPEYGRRRHDKTTGGIAEQSLPADRKKPRPLKSRGSGNEVSTLFDSDGRQIAVKKEGVHFDLAHRNRLEWEPDKLEDFRTKLENRIKAVIF